ncbi:MAG TPA: nuclear transport factor 2 family protein [Polyangiales bacterium]
MSADTHKHRILAAFEQLRTGDSQPFLDLLADDVSWTVQGSTRWSGTYAGKAQVLDGLLRPVMKLLKAPNRTFVERIVAEGDLLAVELRGENITKSDKPYHNRYCWICRMEGGQIRALTEYADTELFTAALQ